MGAIQKILNANHKATVEKIGSDFIAKPDEIEQNKHAFDSFCKQNRSRIKDCNDTYATIKRLSVKNESEEVV